MADATTSTGITWAPVATTPYYRSLTIQVNGMPVVPEGNGRSRTIAPVFFSMARKTFPPPSWGGMLPGTFDGFDPAASSFTSRGWQAYRPAASREAMPRVRRSIRPKRAALLFLKRPRRRLTWWAKSGADLLLEFAD